MAQTKKVGAIGFEIRIHPKVGLIKLIERMIQECDKEINHGPTTQVFYVTEKRKYIIGSALNFKGHKKTIESHRDKDGNLVINKSEIRPGTEGIEPTLFVINPRTLRGMIYNHFGGVTINGLGKFVRDEHDKLRREAYKQKLLEEKKKIKKDTEDIIWEEVKDKIRKEFEGEMSVSVLITPDDLKTLLSKYSMISRFEIAATKAIDDADYFRPIRGLIESNRISISINKKGALARVKEGLLHIFRDRKEEERLKIFGKGYNGETLAEYVGEVKQYYHRYTYDEFIGELPENGVWKEYENCGAMDRLLSLMEDNIATFGRRP